MENSNISSNTIDDFRIYSSRYPKINEFVAVVFINRNESHFEGKLIEYGDMTVIMSYNDATKKKKVHSWNKLVPMNKPILARVEEVNEESEWIQVSIAYNQKIKEGEEDIEFKFYNDNKSLISLINKICINNNVNFNIFWSNIIHEIDKKRLEESDENLYTYFNNNLDYYEELVKSNYENYENIISSTHSNILKKIYKIISKVGIISMSGISKTQEMFKRLTEENNEWEYKIKYDTTPFYGEASMICSSNFTNNIAIQQNSNTSYSFYYYSGIWTGSGFFTFNTNDTFTSSGIQQNPSGCYISPPLR
jgi:hypothetical protein